MASPMRSRRRRGPVGGHFKILRHLVKPRMVLMVVLLFCLNASNGHPSSNDHGYGVSPAIQMQMHAHPPRSHTLQYHKHFFQLLHPSNPSLAQMLLAEPPQNRIGFQMPESIEESVQPDTDENEHNVLIGGIGNGEMVNPGLDMKRRKKQVCGVPTVAVRSFMEQSLHKRSYFAHSPEDVEEKKRQEELTRVKRETASKLHKRDIGSIGTDGPLPWTCETKYEWEDKGADHYPRFVRTAECKSRFCFNGFFRCKPRRYKTKVLKRLTGTEVASCEEDDVSLPESLRSTWKFVTVTINLCCDCTTRVPGTDV